jgi:hypothetical protein
VTQGAEFTRFITSSPCSHELNLWRLCLGYGGVQGCVGKLRAWAQTHANLALIQKRSPRLHGTLDTGQFESLIGRHIQWLVLAENRCKTAACGRQRKCHHSSCKV